jgi:hypothetical protein
LVLFQVLWLIYKQKIKKIIQSKVESLFFAKNKRKNK